MSRRDDMVAALECGQPQGTVPLWELHFHCWEKGSGRHFISGQDFLPLSPQERDRALAEDAEIIVSVAQELGFGGVTIPDPPWDCPYTLPQEARLKLASLLRRHAPDFLVVAGTGGVMGMPGAGNYGDYEEFCYRIFDAPEEIDELAEQTLRRGLDSVKQARDAGVEVVYTASDLADNHGPFFKPEQLELGLALPDRVGRAHEGDGALHHPAHRWRHKDDARGDRREWDPCCAGTRPGGGHGYVASQSTGWGRSLLVRECRLRSARGGAA